MSDPGSQLKAVFKLVTQPIVWFLNQFEDCALIALAFLGAGVLFIGGMFVVGHWAPVKQPAVDTHKIFSNSYTTSHPASSVHAIYPQHHYVQQGHLEFPQNTYHRPHHVYSHGHHTAHQSHGHNYHTSYGHQMATVSNTTPDGSAYINTHQVHSTHKTPYAKHRFGRPRGSSDNTEDTSFDFNPAGGAHAHH